MVGVRVEVEVGLTDLELVFLFGVGLALGFRVVVEVVEVGVWAGPTDSPDVGVAPKFETGLMPRFRRD